MERSPSSHAQHRLLPHKTIVVGSFDIWPLVRTVAWAIAHFAFYFVQQVAELLAPFVLVIGVGWAILPRAVDAVARSSTTVDPQAHDIITHVSDAIPSQIEIAGHVLTAASLVFDGFALMALAALGATIAALAAREL